MSKKKQQNPYDSNGLQDWGTYMAAKKSKLEEQFDKLAQSEFQDATNLFRGVAIFVNGYTNPCADVLKRLMMEHGGIYHTYQSSRSTTHLIASNLPYSKIIQYRKSKNPLPLCKPEWITDSIKANKLLDWRPYLLYNNTSVTQPQLQLKNQTNDLAKRPQDPDMGPSTRKEDPGLTVDPQAPPLESSKFSNSENHKEKSPKIREEQAKPSGAALCSKNEEFLSEFYNNSRLHHIATMGATFKDYVNELRSKNDGSFPGFDRLKILNRKNSTGASARDKNEDSDSDEDLFSPKLQRNKNKKESIIMHIDMDCFFVSVGLRNRPELRGHPVAVTHAKGKASSRGKEDEELGSMSEIASCSYEARRAGLKNGMFLGQALKLCPNLKTIKYDFEGYKEVSYTLYNTVASYTLDIEAVSCDEMYADISKILEESTLTPSEFAAIIRAEIKEKTGCPVSTGFGSNKLQARLATKRAKPDGQFHLKSDDVESYVGGIKIGDIPGVGWSTMHQLRKINVEFCRDLQKISLGALQEKFGKKHGEMLFNTCRGIDHSKLSTEHVRKSVSAEINYGIRFESDDDARGFIIKLAKEVCSRLSKINAKGRCVTLKLMVREKNAPVDPAKFMGHGLCDNFTKSKNFMTPVDDEVIITKDVLLLWEQMQQPAHEIRGIGIQISRLENLKCKTVNNNLMKFIERGRAVEKNRETREEIKNIVIAENKNRILEVKKNVETKRNRDLKTFFSAKKSLTENPKGKASYVEENSKIDESVLAELPEDIRLEILKIHKPDIKLKNPSTHDKLKSHLLNTESKENKNISTEKFLPPSQGIDGDVLIELPEEIRNEILASKPVIKKSEPNAIDHYFKHKKCEIRSEAKMPTMHELDMQVLIELPDDIRNEILNEYKDHKTENTSTTENRNLPLQETRKNIENTINNKNPIDDLNCSFSQVDPEFLAALDNETRNDVKEYCLAKKKEKASKLRKIDEKLQNSAHPIPKKRGRKPKAVLSSGKNSKALPRTKKKSSEKCGPHAPKRHNSFLENEMSILEGNGPPRNDPGNKIQCYPYNSRENAVNNSKNALKTEQQLMLNTLVNYLFSLPLQQVKKQIQTWINNSDMVNEIDSLSITTYLSMLPKEKRIEDLHTLMKTMHRCMTETGSCVWHGTYRKTVEHVQQCMQIEYNSNLMLPAIRCNLRECRSDGV
ncbi:DNA repair protein REV1 [Fopius arisanus]|uniref:DNA repair protein REV1 n=1 Tax=Fopius arisanus TaxID=64838 RepID=A0A0C9QYL9_9HYME|nr:PREDICTED: DNA repair protein REV1 [Fopius arisanus]